MSDGKKLGDKDRTKILIQQEMLNYKFRRTLNMIDDTQNPYSRSSRKRERALVEEQKETRSVYTY